MPQASCCGCSSCINKLPGFDQASGHITAQPHVVPRAEALILAANQQRMLSDQGRVQVL
jgi:L-lactate utilization protein LutB